MVRVAVLGGSKGCARAMVIQGLEQDASHEFKLLVRYPENLDYTEDQKSKITIVKGDAGNADSVKETIANADVVIYSIGSGFNMFSGTMTSPGLCKDTMTVLLKVVEELSEEERPKRLVIVSSAGVDGTKDVPFLFRPLYHYLHAPHVDKKDLEVLVEHENKHIPDWIIVRPSILTDGKLIGKYRAAEDISGYTISRNDVGHFLLYECITPTTWIKKKVLVTY